MNLTRCTTNRFTCTGYRRGIHTKQLNSIVATIIILSWLTSCTPPDKSHGFTEADLNLLLGKSVREVVTKLEVPESALRVGDEPPGRFRFITFFLPGEPLGRRLTIYVSREAALISNQSTVKPADLFDKVVTGVAISFPIADKKPDVAVGDVITHFHTQP